MLANTQQAERQGVGTEHAGNAAAELIAMCYSPCNVLCAIAEPLQRNWATLTLQQRVQGKPSAPVAARLCGRQHHCGRAKTIWRAARKPPPGCFGDTSTRCQDDSGSGQPQHPGPRDEQTGDESSESAPIESFISATQVI